MFAHFSTVCQPSGNIIQYKRYGVLPIHTEMEQTHIIKEWVTE